MANNGIALTARNFDEYKNELLTYINDYYPDLSSSFLDNSIGQVLLELNAGIGDSLNFYIDKGVNENFIDFAQEKGNLINLAKTFGNKIPNKAASIVVCDFTVDVPVDGDTFSKDYLPIIKVGTQVLGDGVPFELIDDIDFNSEFSNTGIPNRTHQPVFDNNNNIVRYEVTKREVIYNGKTKQYRTIVNNSSDFYKVILPDVDVLSVEQIVIKNGVDTPTELPISDYFNEDERYYEVDYLAQTKIFKTNGVRNEDGSFSGTWENIEQKFIKEFTKNNFCQITFGSGQGINNDFANVLQDDNFSLNVINGLLKNNALGVRVPSNSSIFVRYRVGGGANTNVPIGTINKFGFSDVVVNGLREDINDQVRRSLVVNNPIPALGGRDVLSEEEIRYLTKFSTASQGRCVTENDYLFQASNMDGRFGRPSKIKVTKEDNKVVINTLGLTSDGKLNNQTTQTLKENIVNYLCEFKMINDFLTVKDAEIINIGYNVDLLVDENVQKEEILQNVINVITDFHLTTKREVGQLIFLGELVNNIYAVTGVRNINNLAPINIVDESGELYSPVASSMQYTNEQIENNTTLYRRELVPVNNTLFVNPNQIFEIRFPENDIVLTTKNII